MSRVKILALFFSLVQISRGQQQYVISTLAGGAPPPLSAVATATYIGLPQGIATDASGNVYFTSLNCVFRVDSKGTLTRIAGNGVGGYGGDGLPATAAQLNAPGGLAVDGSGNVYVADSGNGRIRRITAGGIIATVAGGGSTVFSGDGGPAVSAGLSPTSVALDAAGDLIIYDSGNYRIRKVSPNGIVQTIAGNGVSGFGGDGGPAISASLSPGRGIAADAAGNVYFADSNNGRIREITTGGTIMTVAGGGTGGDGGPAAQASLGVVSGVAVDSTGRIFISAASSIRVVSAGGTISTLSPPGATSDPILGVNALAVAASGNVLIADTTGRVRAISPALGLSTFAGPGSPAFGPNQNPTSVRLQTPSSVAADAAGNVVFADFIHSWLYRVSPSGVLDVIGDPSQPNAVAVNASGNYYAVSNGAVVKANFTGSVPPAPVIVAGGGTSTADGIPATSKYFLEPLALAVDGSGNLFIADSDNYVYKVSAAGIITKFAGSGTETGTVGEGGPATAASMCPISLATDAAGNLFIGDGCSGRVRKVTPAGVISTVAGGAVPTGPYNPTMNGDGGSALNVVLDPWGIAVDAAGNLYIAEGWDVRKVSGGIINTIAGGSQASHAGNGGPATQAYVDAFGIALDAAGHVYLADRGYGVIRVLTPTANPVLISAVLDAASESAAAITPGKIVAVYGSGLGPGSVAVNTPSQGAFGTSVAGTQILFNGVAAPMIYASANQAAAIAPYELAGSASVQVVVRSGAGVSSSYTAAVAPAAPSMFTSNLTGAGHVAAVNADGTINTAANPAHRGDFISFYATGEGQTVPPGTDGALANGTLPRPALPVQVTIGGISAPPVYAGAAPTEVSGLMQVVVYIPAGVQPGGYVPVVLTIGSAATPIGAAWIAVQ